MKTLLIAFISILLVSCSGVSVERYNSIKVELDSLKSEIQKYKDKYGELSISDNEYGKFGIWKINCYVDEWGEKTTKRYISTELNGTFSNSATTNSDLMVLILIDKESIRIQLHEYGNNHPIKDKGFLNFKAKDKDGNIYEFKTYNAKDGNNTVVNMEYEFDDTIVRNLLLKGGEIKFVGCSSGSVLDEYKFNIINADYLSEAISNI